MKTKNSCPTDRSAGAGQVSETAAADLTGSDMTDVMGVRRGTTMLANRLWSDPTAESQLYDNVSPMADKLVGRDPAGREIGPQSLLGEAFLKLTRGQQRLWGSGEFRRFLRHVGEQIMATAGREKGRVKRGGAGDRKRRQADGAETRQPWRRADGAEDHLPGRPSNEPGMTMDMDAAFVRLREADPKLHEVFKRVVRDEQSIEQTAEQLGVHVRTVGRRLRDAKKLLRAELNGW